MSTTDVESTFESSKLHEESPSIQILINEARSLHEKTFGNGGIRKSSSENHDQQNENYNQRTLVSCSVAPGRVNLIGEHVDYTGGYVCPMAIDYSTVCYGIATISTILNSTSILSKKGLISGNCSVVSTAQPENKVTFSIGGNDSMTPLPGSASNWANYVVGVIDGYMNAKMSNVDDSHYHHNLCLTLAIAGDVPLGSGLSSSAALEVSTATFMESILAKFGFILWKTIEHEGTTSSSSSSSSQPKIAPKDIIAKNRALLCQKAENTFCNSPCGIMDQYVSSAAKKRAALLIDCRSLQFETVLMGQQKFAHLEQSQQNEQIHSYSSPVFVVCNSNVTHSIAGGEYPIRVKQCQTATEVLQKIFLEEDKHDSSNGNSNSNSNIHIQSLRDANPSHLLHAKTSGKMDDITYQRAMHVVTENERTTQFAHAMRVGNWEEMGKLMNESHASMRDMYEVSCEEIDVLVNLASQEFNKSTTSTTGRVYGSRLTGGGFGGCTVTLVDKSCVKALCDYLKTEYKKICGKDCFCFESSPGPGTREVLIG
mmetsp:Transcript_19851/g.27932  ORF Transcript_19851/g.27932 Transcript_19851/m.27932 type:complete len:540 (-) Transcript_19851:207-1826(-)